MKFLFTFEKIPTTHHQMFLDRIIALQIVDEDNEYWYCIRNNSQEVIPCRKLPGCPIRKYFTSYNEAVSVYKELFG